MANASTVAFPARWRARLFQGSAGRGCRGPWWVLLVLLGAGSSVSACWGCPDNHCSKSDTAPEGTRFQIEVLEEVSDCDSRLVLLQPGDSFFMTAGPTVGVMKGGGCAACPITQAAGPPEGIETEFEYVRCGSDGRATLQATCEVTYPELCPTNPDGTVMFNLRGTDLLDATPSEAEFVVMSFVSSECPLEGCIDKYRVRISGVTEE